MLRVPSLSMKVLEEISACHNLDELLREYYSMPLVSDALFLASPLLHQITEGWLKEEDAKLKNPDKFKLSLLKYLIRMSSRSTPFGLFAGICTGYFSPEQEIEMSSPAKHTLHVRPDMQFLCTMAAKIVNEHVVRDKIQYYPNSSISRIGNEYRYIEYYTDEDGIRKYQLQSTAINPEIEKVIIKAVSASNIGGMAGAIVTGDISTIDATEYVNTLINNQVLVSALEPRVSGTPYMEELLAQLSSLGISSEGIKDLEKINIIIGRLNDGDTADRISAYNSIIDIAKKSGVNSTDGFFIQADLRMSFENNTLSNGIKRDLMSALRMLMKHSRSRNHSLLDNFRDAFLRRYEMREIPLSIALDAEAGPGYLTEDRNANASPLLEGIILPLGSMKTMDISWDPIDRMLYRKLQDALISGDEEIEITDSDISVLEMPDKPLPLSFSIMAKIHGQWEKDPDKQLIQLESVGGSSAVNLAGRFCYLDDDLSDTIKEITGIEQELMGDVIIAEIVHLPQQRTGNILMRSVLREYEIPYLARPAVETEYTIPISDLMVSVRHDKVMLRSKRLDKYILPRLSNAHNYAMGALPIYRFLCDLQTQGLNAAPGFSWGALENDSIYLPRVVYRNIILQPATWNLHKKEIKSIADAKSNGDLLNAVNKLRAKYKIPGKVILAAGDNELWIDLENIYCLRLLQNEIKNMQEATLREYLFQPDKCIVRANEEPFAHECVFFIHQKADIEN